MARTRLLAACLVALLLAPTLALAGLGDVAARDPEDRKEEAPQAGGDTEGGGEVRFGPCISRQHFMAPRQCSTCWRAITSSRWACALPSGSALLYLTTTWLL